MARKKYQSALKSVSDAESELITAKLDLERYQEELFKIKAQDPDQPLEYRDLDIAAFKEKLPEILKKLT